MITIRPFANSDAQALVEIYRHSVTEIGPNAYNPEQVAVGKAAADTGTVYRNHDRWSVQPCRG